MPVTDLNDLSKLQLYPILNVAIWTSDEDDPDPVKHFLWHLMEDSNIAIEEITRPTALGGERWMASRVTVTAVMAYSNEQHGALTQLCEDLKQRRIAAQVQFGSDMAGRTTGTLQLINGARVELALRKETAGEILRSTLTLRCVVRSINNLISL